MTVDFPFSKTKPILLTVPLSQTKLVVSLAKPKSILASPFAQPESKLASTLAQAEAKLLLIAFPEPEAKLAIPFAKTKGVTSFSWTKRTKHLLRDLPFLRIS